MRKSIVIIFIFFSLSSFGQTKKDNYKGINFSVLGGISFVGLKEAWGSFHFEGKANISTNILLKLSFGYTKIISSEDYNVKSYSHSNIDNDNIYYSLIYNVERVDYNIIPISVGIQYNINESLFNPYSFFEIGYNLIDPRTERTEFQFLEEYSSFNELPLEHQYLDVLPNSSYRIAIGVGFKYRITDAFNFELRYSTQIDTEIVNSQQLLFGVSF